MAEVRCRRCGEQRSGLEAPPLPGEAGSLIQDGTCRDCWQLWLAEQVKHINELQLSPVNPEHYDLLVGKMRVFLKLDG